MIYLYHVFLKNLQDTGLCIYRVAILFLCLVCWFCRERNFEFMCLLCRNQTNVGCAEKFCFFVGWGDVCFVEIKQEGGKEAFTNFPIFNSSEIVLCNIFVKLLLSIFFKIYTSPFPNAYSGTVAEYLLQFVSNYILFKPFSS